MANRWIGCTLKLNDFFHPVCFQILFDNYLNIIVIHSWFNTFVYCREAKSHIIDIKIAETGIFPVYNFDSASFLLNPAFIDNKKVAACEDKFFSSF